MIYTVLSIGVSDPFVNTFHQLICCKQQFHGTCWYDWVVLYDLADKDFKIQQGIDKYLFAQVLLLFAIEQNNEVYRLAYLEWYNITDISEISEGKVQMVAWDSETHIATAIWSRKFNVVSVNAIIRAVHMQPLFQDHDSAQKMLENKLDAYSFDRYLVNKYVDRVSWEELF